MNENINIGDSLFNNSILLFANLLSRCVIILISIFIVLNLFIRGYAPGEALYPHDDSRFPYVQPCSVKDVKRTDGTTYCKTTKLYEVNQPTSPDEHIFNYVNDKDFENIKIPYDQTKYKEDEHNKIFTPSGMYLISSLFQNSISDYKKRQFDSPINCLFFLSLLVSVKTKVIINKILAGFHNLLFSSVKSNGILFFILSLLMVIFIETNVQNGSVDKLLKFVLRDFKNDENSKSNIIEYIVKLVYSIFGGFVTFLHFTKYLLFPMIFIILITIWGVKTPVKMMFTRGFYFLATTTMMSFISSLVFFPQTIIPKFKKELNHLSNNNILDSFKNIRINGFFSFLGSIFTVFGLLIMSIFYIYISVTSILSFLPLLFVGFTTITSLSYDISLGFLFNENVRKLILLLFQRFSQLIKIMFMIFAVDVIYKVLGTNALYTSLALFTVFFGLDYFKNNNSKSSDDKKKNNILGDLDDIENFMPFQKS